MDDVLAAPYPGGQRQHMGIFGVERVDLDGPAPGGRDRFARQRLAAFHEAIEDVADGGIAQASQLGQVLDGGCFAGAERPEYGVYVALLDVQGVDAQGAAPYFKTYDKL